MILSEEFAKICVVAVSYLCKQMSIVLGFWNNSNERERDAERERQREGKKREKELRKKYPLEVNIK